MIKSSAPLISILMPIYNQEAYILPTIESIVSQTYRHLEIIISDDCSADKTYDLCVAYKWPSDFKVFLNRHAINLGVAQNSAYCMRLATGKYILPFSGDDLMEPNMVQTLYDTLLRSPNTKVVFARSLASQSFSRSVFKLNRINQNAIIGGYVSINAVDFLHSFISNLNNQVFTMGALFDWQTDSQVPGDISAGSLSDFKFIVDYLSKNEFARVSFLDSPLFLYTIRQGGISSTGYLHEIPELLKRFEDECPHLSMNYDQARGRLLSTILFLAKSQKFPLSYLLRTATSTFDNLPLFRSARVVKLAVKTILRSPD